MRHGKLKLTQRILVALFAVVIAVTSLPMTAMPVLASQAEQPEENVEDSALNGVEGVADDETVGTVSDSEPDGGTDEGGEDETEVCTFTFVTDEHTKVYNAEGTEEITELTALVGSTEELGFLIKVDEGYTISSVRSSDQTLVRVRGNWSNGEYSIVGRSGNQIIFTKGATITVKSVAISDFTTVFTYEEEAAEIAVYVEDEQVSLQDNTVTSSNTQDFWFYIKPKGNSEVSAVYYNTGTGEDAYQEEVYFEEGDENGVLINYGRIWENGEFVIVMSETCSVSFDYNKDYIQIYDGYIEEFDDGTYWNTGQEVSDLSSDNSIKVRKDQPFYFRVEKMVEGGTFYITTTGDESGKLEPFTEIDGYDTISSATAFEIYKIVPTADMEITCVVIPHTVDIRYHEGLFEDFKIDSYSSTCGFEITMDEDKKSLEMLGYTTITFRMKPAEGRQIHSAYFTKVDPGIGSEEINEEVYFNSKEPDAEGYYTHIVGSWNVFNCEATSIVFLEATSPKLQYDEEEFDIVLSLNGDEFNNFEDYSMFSEKDIVTMEVRPVDSSVVPKVTYTTGTGDNAVSTIVEGQNSDKEGWLKYVFRDFADHPVITVEADQPTEEPGTEPEELIISGNLDKVYDGKPVDPANTEGFTINKPDGEGIVVAYHYYGDAEGNTYLEQPPVNAGTYWLKVTRAVVADVIKKEMSNALPFTISPAEISIDTVTLNKETVQELSDVIEVSNVSFKGLPEGETLHKDADYTAEVSWSLKGNKAVAEITVSLITANYKLTECVVEKEISYEPKPETEVYVVTNAVGTLADIKLPQGWSWVDENVQLNPFAGAEEKTFAAKYTNPETGKTADGIVTVKMSTIQDLKVTDGTEEIKEVKIATETKKKLSVSYRVAGLALPADYKVSFSAESANMDIATCAMDGNNVVVTPMKAGKTTITVVLKDKEDRELLKCEQKINVVDSTKKGVADVKVTLVDQAGNEIKMADGVYQLQKDAEVYLRNETAKKADGSEYKISYKTSDGSVAGIGKADSENKSLTKLEVKKTGFAVITATANDAIGSSVRLNLKVKDYSITIGQNTATLYTAMKDPKVQFMVYNGFDGILTQAKFLGENAEVTPDGTVTIRKAGQGELEVTLKDGEEEKKATFNITVKENGKAPKVSVKQIASLNAHYKNGWAKFTIGADGEVVKNVIVKDLAPEKYSFDATTGILTLKDTTGAKKETFVISFADYEAAEATVSVRQVKESFKLSATSGTVYNGMENQSVRIRLLNKKTGLAETGMTVEVNDKDNYRAVVDGDTVVIEVIGEAKNNQTLKLTFRSGAWRNEDGITLNFKMKVADLSKASLQLGQKKLTLYHYEGMHAGVETSLTLKGGMSLEGLTVAVDEILKSGQTKAQGDTLSVTYESGKIVVRKLKEGLKGGSYKFNVELKDSIFTKPVKTTLTVKVVESNASSSITKSGSIDVLNREGSSLTLKGSFKNVIKDASVTDAQLIGRDAHLFKITGINGKNVTVQLKADADVITKYDYIVGVRYTVQSGETELMLDSNELKIRLTQKKPKVKIQGKGTYSNTKTEEEELNVVIYNSAKVRVDVQRVTLLNYTRDFSYENGKLVHKPTGETATGKSYSLKFAVYPKGAGDNEKPITVTYKIKIVK